MENNGTPPEAPPAEVPTGLTPADMAAGTEPGTASDEITWVASEFVAHEKSVVWFLGLALVAVIAAALAHLITKDYISVGVVFLAAIMMGVFATHKPREVEYRLDARGLTIGQKHYKYEQFRSFAIVQDGAFTCIVFMPLKRFATLTTIYYPPEEEEIIVEILSDCLPLTEHTPDAVDRLMSRIRF